MIQSHEQSMVPGDYEAAQVEALVATQWSLQDYLAWLGRRDRQLVLDGWWVGSLTRDPAHWAEVGVVSAADLAAYLDAECERERRKDAMAGWDSEDDHVGRSDQCMHCGDLADFGTGWQLCKPCHAHMEAAYHDEDPYRDLLREAEGQPEPDGDLDDELSPALDVRLCAARLSAYARLDGWHSPGVLLAA